ncbi:prolyl oligopeptidase family serine peptidase [Paraflavitalea sp. CAU 1676]|uniref:alpha/beta hydrolase family protein n=1 Tax=Paraflavitalea sp. CAU 1676 TaxID=3032598 RepID=UPI0023DA8287|nr:prolyl oligopeptidase family serine peptidase [Paraflavitalea sp. CAU 1676]MDF2191776.1 prolyl oligopeptidase family serine peptidase [Paraflavitalea sp. CAU 1676]
MRRLIYLLPGLLCSVALMAQKKPLDHSVYDGWQSIGERAISNNGKYVAYAITPQEGDATLVLQAADNSWKKEIARGYGATITEDSRFVVFRIRAPFKDTRDARIKKKTPNDMPKDSLGIIELGKTDLTKIARIKSFKTPVKGTGQWMAYLLEKAVPEASKPAKPDSLTQVNNLLRMADSLVRVADSLRGKVTEAQSKGLAALQAPKREGGRTGRGGEEVEEGTELVLRNLYTGEEKKFKLVNDYFFSEQGNVLVYKTTRKNGDSLSKAALLWTSLPSGKVDTVMRKFNDIKNIAFDETGAQLAFVAERDSVTKALQKFYKLYYYKPGFDSARLQVDRSTAGVSKGLTVSENYFLTFSKDGSKLFFGLAAIRKPKDTTLVEFETARLDVWHYNDDYLQPQQLLQSAGELRKSYASVLHIGSGKLVQLGTDSSDNIQLVDEGNAGFVLGTSSKGNRVEAQWQGFSRQRAYIISLADGSHKLIRDKQRGFFAASPKGNFVLWYDMPTKQYFTYEVSTGTVRNITQKVTAHLYDDEDDHPDDPSSFGTAGWLDNDAAVLIYDRYDIWQVDPRGEKLPVNVTGGYGKKNKIVLRYVRTDPEQRTIAPDEQIIMDAFNRTTKYDGYFTKKLSVAGDPVELSMAPVSNVAPRKAKQADVFILGRMNVQEAANVYTTSDLTSFTRLSEINPQQKDYNWLTSELVKWKMLDGKEAEGLLFKPENFDPKKKYPVIFYFYERDADGLYNYRAPAPSASTVNIAYFVSNGYLVFDPNIYYKNGEPGESAYNSVVSAARYMAKMPWVDSTKMAIQGQSWGGYQVAYLVTRTKMFAAAGAGAPVANMTSAYGGIRWGSGLNRQFQYEHSQSRIGATLWQKPDLYLKNSPLFKADKVTTPLLIMHNDADGAVPWYQGIEYFTALRRLGKKVWMLQYNGEDHNLVERRNRKDLSIRLGQFFDHYLKGAPAAKWIAEGVPATDKGIDWGTTVEEKRAF